MSTMPGNKISPSKAIPDRCNPNPLQRFSACVLVGRQADADKVGMRVVK